MRLFQEIYQRRLSNSFIAVHELFKGLAFLQNINGYLNLAKVREELNKVKSKENKSERTKKKFILLPLA